MLSVRRDYKDYSVGTGQHRTATSAIRHTQLLHGPGSVYILLTYLLLFCALSSGACLTCLTSIVSPPRRTELAESSLASGTKIPVG